MSQNKAIDDITRKLKACATNISSKSTFSGSSPGTTSTSRESSPLKKPRLKKFKKKNVTATINKDKDYYLYPIGSAVQSLGIVTPQKWVDVASIINQGTFTHKNIDSRASKKPEFRVTLNAGSLSSMYVRKKMYAVSPVVKPMVNLQQLLDTNSKTRIFGETHAKFVCINLMMALRFLHENGVFHASICPKKVVFNERYYPCLSGFGTAEVIDERQSRPRERTQLEYTSPEQLWTEHLTEVTDMYSTACLTYAMIYGKPPHQGVNGAVTRRNIMDATFEPPFGPEKISEAGERLIMRCIRKKRRDRYSILFAKESLASNITWFHGLCEDKLYKQVLPSPMASTIKQHLGKTKT